MKLDDYKELEICEIVGNVRNSNIAQGCSLFQLSFKRGLIGYILNLLQYQGSVDNLDEYARAESFLTDFCGLQGEGTLESPFCIETIFASGGFVDLHEFMPKKQIPGYIKNNECHKNSFLFASQETDSNVLTGIYGYKENRRMNLHSVIEIKGVVLDFNWKIAMTKDLYLQLFNFEVLNTVSGKRLAEDREIISKGADISEDKFTYAELLACYDEVIQNLKEEIKKHSC